MFVEFVCVDKEIGLFFVFFDFKGGGWGCLKGVGWLWLGCAVVFVGYFENVREFLRGACCCGRRRCRLFGRFCSTILCNRGFLRSPGVG